jgi:hypothetical protein
MTALNLSRLSGPDAVAALRSYARRFRTAILPTDDPEVEELAYQIGPDGHSALDHTVAATNTFVLIGQALRQTLATDDPLVHAATTDAAQREWATPPGLHVREAIERLGEEAGALADQAEGIELHTWNRVARVAGGGEITALGLLKEAVAAGAEHLRAATEDVAAARARQR